MLNQISYQIEDRLYLNITDRCTLGCSFCPKNCGSMDLHEYDLSLDHRPSSQEVIVAIGDPAAYTEIVFCGYGEPTLRLKVLLEASRYIKEHGGKVRINTDGLANLVHKHNVLPELGRYVDSLSISLNGQNQEVYDRHCLPAMDDSYQAMLEFLRLAPNYIPHVTATAIEGLEGVDIAACEKIAADCGVGFRKRILGVVG
ncbi:MAG: radical SAM protein [Gammaproteobacteria bacterium]|nr:radical SAM protein [Gammaproteobacteria bacterium]